MQNLQKEILHDDSEKNLMLASKSKEQVHTFFSGFQSCLKKLVSRDGFST